MPVMGSSLAQKIAGRHLFLYRQNGDYVLKDTVVGKLFRGLQQYIDEKGENKFLILKDDVMVPSTGPTSKISVEIEEKMPDAIWETISDFLHENQVKDSAFMARNIVDSYMKNGSFDLRPVSVRLGGAALGMLLYRDVPGVSEPEIVQKLRKAIGKTMAPFVEGLRSALDMEGIEVTEKSATVPRHARSDKEDRHPTRDPKKLDERSAETSMDVPSLVLTAVSQDSNDSERVAAIDRLIDIIVFHPKAYGAMSLGDEDLSRISAVAGCPGNESACSTIKRLSLFVRMANADDTEFVEAFNRSDEEDQQLMAIMATHQNRQHILTTNPRMALKSKFMGRLLADVDPTDEESLAAIKEALQRPGRPNRSLENKVMQALYVNPDSELLEMALNSRGAVRDLAMVLLIEKGGKEGLERVLGELEHYRKGRGRRRPTLLAVALVMGAGDDERAMRAAKALGVSPEEIAPFVGRKRAVQYMRTIRSGWDGNGLPMAADIHEVPEEPMCLIKDFFELAQAGDKNALASLHRMFHLMSQKDSDVDAFRFLQSAMDHLGQDSEMLLELTPKPSGEKLFAKMLPDGSVLTKRSGRYYVENTEICFCTSPSNAVKVAVAKISEAREKALASESK